jgi:hypothetical protein
MTATARPRSRALPRPRGSQPPGTAWQCFLDAGGNTPAYDADRYMGLLKDRGVLRPRRGLVEILGVVLIDWSGEPYDSDALTESASRFARLLVDQLGKDGYRIHDVDRCVRPGDPALVGRPMSPEEEKQVGIWEGR